MAKFVLLWLLMGSAGPLGDRCRWCRSSAFCSWRCRASPRLLIVYAVLSWVPTASSMLQDLIERLAEPLVRPLRALHSAGGRRRPVAAGRASCLLQVGAIVLGSLMGAAFGLGR